MITGTRTRTVLSQINVTPLVDVVLVLLIIFMVTAPMLQEGIDVNLPKVKAEGIALAEEELIVLTINKQGEVYINNNKMVFSELKDKLEAIYKRKTDKVLLLRADKDVSYGYVVKTMAEIRKAGIQRVGMVTEPSPEF